jgi:4-hydroxy-3-polyprenylbenzoate decarboxylase
VPAGLPLPLGFADPRVALPGVLAVRAPAFVDGSGDVVADVAAACALWAGRPQFDQFPLVVLVDDSAFAARSLENFLWVTFTRANPAVDVAGGGASVVHKHWGCRGPLVIDARIKPHHAPPLEEDPAVERRVDALFASDPTLARLV